MEILNFCAYCIALLPTKVGGQVQASCPSCEREVIHRPQRIKGTFTNIHAQQFKYVYYRKGSKL